MDERMENKAPVLWDGKSEETVRKLRPPKSSVLSGNSPQNSESADKTAALNKAPFKSKLSAEAKEFVPKGFVVAAQPSSTITSNSSVQNRLNKHKVRCEPQEQFEGSADDVRLNQLIETLTKDPAQFEHLVEIFVDTLAPFFEDVFALSRAAQLLIGKAINNPNFRYTAARLCFVIEQNCPKFRAELHLTCQKQLEETSNKSGLVLFVAELYTQLPYENIYGHVLIDAYKKLLDNGGNDNVKAICQALKLTGHSLDLYDKKALDEVFLKLNDVKHTVNGTALSLINSVVNLRGSQWGRDNTDNHSASAEPEAYWGEPASQIFYDIEGEQILPEESEFLATYMTSTEEFLTDDGFDPDELCDPEPEMDEEIQAAFKDFVKLSKR